MIAGGLGGGSLQEMFAHIVGSEELWLRRWNGDGRARLPAGPDFADLAAIIERWEQVERDRSDLLDGLSDGDLEQTVHYMSVTRHVEEEFPVWQTMIHPANHTTHHRAEALAALTSLGSPAESVDLIDFLRAAKQPPA